MKCQKCNTEFNEAMASCGTGDSYSVFRCPNCQYEEVVQIDYSPIDMLKKVKTDEV